MRRNFYRYDDIVNIPEVGDIIYLPSERSLSHGMDDIQGGKATVTAVVEQLCGGHVVLFIQTALKPDTLTNWKFLEPQQAELAARFGNAEAHPDPDDRAEFNDANENWP